MCRNAAWSRLLGGLDGRTIDYRMVADACARLQQRTRDASRSNARRRGLAAQLVGEENIVIQSIRGQFHQMLVMGEEQNLGPFGELGQGLECGNGAVVVEVDQDIIDDE